MKQGIGYWASIVLTLLCLFVLFTCAPVAVMQQELEDTTTEQREAIESISKVSGAYHNAIMHLMQRQRGLERRVAKLEQEMEQQAPED